jgi:hypothetical protein
MSTGYFVISLDMDLMWGFTGNQKIRSGGANVLGAWKAIPIMLERFAKLDIHCTWATVGFLFCANKERIYAIMPASRPHYADIEKSSYVILEGIGKDEREDPSHYAGTLINLIKETPNQEIATLTFSNYYCLAQGQTKEQFRQDMLAAIEAAEPYDIEFHSMAFPRNELNLDYLEVLAENGIYVYRSNLKNWINATPLRYVGPLQKALNWVDTYTNISGPNCQTLDEMVKMNNMFDIRISRFLVPYSPKLAFIEPLKIKRIKKQMLHAAQKGEIFHLCWHPHQFGLHLEESFKNLTDILDYFALLKNAYNFESLTMEEMALESGRIAQEVGQQAAPLPYVITPGGRGEIR